MNQREVRRRARFIAHELIIGDIEAGLDIASYTDSGSNAEARLLETALREIAAWIRRPLPAGYQIDADAPGSGRAIAVGHSRK
jgi:hypothetical protein